MGGGGEDPRVFGGLAGLARTGDGDRALAHQIAFFRSLICTGARRNPATLTTQFSALEQRKLLLKWTIQVIVERVCRQLR